MKDIPQLYNTLKDIGQRIYAAASRLDAPLGPVAETKWIALGVAIAPQRDAVAVLDWLAGRDDKALEYDAVREVIRRRAAPNEPGVPYDRINNVLIVLYRTLLPMVHNQGTSVLLEVVTNWAETLTLDQLRTATELFPKWLEPINALPLGTGETRSDVVAAVRDRLMYCLARRAEQNDVNGLLGSWNVKMLDSHPIPPAVAMATEYAIELRSPCVITQLVDTLTPFMIDSHRKEVSAWSARQRVVANSIVDLLATNDTTVEQIMAVLPEPTDDLSFTANGHEVIRTLINSVSRVRHPGGNNIPSYDYRLEIILNAISGGGMIHPVVAGIVDGSFTNDGVPYPDRAQGNLRTVKHQHGTSNVIAAAAIGELYKRLTNGRDLTDDTATDYILIVDAVLASLRQN